MKLIDFLASLKDAPLTTELVFQTREQCSCNTSEVRCYCSHDYRDRSIEAVLFEREHPSGELYVDAKVLKIVILINA